MTWGLQILFEIIKIGSFETKSEICFETRGHVLTPFLDTGLVRRQDKAKTVRVRSELESASKAKIRDGVKTNTDRNQNWNP